MIQFQAFLDKFDHLFPLTKKAGQLINLEPTLVGFESVSIPRRAHEIILEFIHLMQKLSEHRGYLEAIAKPPYTSMSVTPQHLGVFSSFDFHLVDGQPKLIEINTNAAMSTIFYALDQMQPAPEFPNYRNFVQNMFQNEIYLARGKTAGSEGFHFVVSDHNPTAQAMRFEFHCTKEILEELGWRGEVVDTESLQISGKNLLSGDQIIDLVYLRDTDFYLKERRSRPVLEAYKESMACVTPHPYQYYALADKLRLRLLSNDSFLSHLSILTDTEKNLIRSVNPQAKQVSDFATPEELWASRAHYFFKPQNSFGSKAVYKGKSISRKIFEYILREKYIAQELCPPDEISIASAPGTSKDFKYDLRYYVYNGQVFMNGARVYQGQVTNFKTLGGGAATVRFHD